MKLYRHPMLEASLSKRRLNQEVRCILRCRKNGVAAPCIYHLDYESARIYMALVEGKTLKDWLIALPSETAIDSKLKTVGESLAKLHDADVVHGDLTSSNIMVSLECRQQPRQDFAGCSAIHLFAADVLPARGHLCALSWALFAFLVKRTLTHPDSIGGAGEGGNGNVHSDRLWAKLCFRVARRQGSRLIRFGACARKYAYTREAHGQSDSGLQKLKAIASDLGETG